MLEALLCSDNTVSGLLWNSRWIIMAHPSLMLAFLSRVPALASFWLLRLDIIRVLAHGLPLLLC